MRADQLLVERGLATSRSQAQRLIASGVRWLRPRRLEGRRARMATRCRRTPSSNCSICAEARYVSRGGLKLEGALTASGIDVAGQAVPRRRPVDRRLHRLPAAARRGAGDRRRRRPWPVARQAAQRPARDRHREGQRARADGPDQAGGDFDFVTSATFLHFARPWCCRRWCRLLKPGGDLLMLVKPQFELQPGQVGKRGIVTDPALYAVVEKRAARLLRGARPAGARLVRQPDRPAATAIANSSSTHRQRKDPEEHDPQHDAVPDQLRIFPAQDARGRGQAARGAPAAVRAEARVLLGDLWRRRLDPGRHLRHGAGDPGRRRGRGVAFFLHRRDARRACASSWRMLRAMGVKRLVALRGDLPSGYGTGGEFHYASDLVAFIRAETGDDFRIEVACYPEMHPQARSPEADLQAFAAKVRAGANSAITQYFYNADAYFRFVDEARALGVDVPVVPGIMPITNSTAADALFRYLRRRDPALDPAAAAELRRRQRVDQGVRPGRGDAAVRTAARRRRARACISTR